ncbi:MAG: hypothetical protein ACHQFX_16705 [Chitinophagales bacterium]
MLTVAQFWEWFKENNIAYTFLDSVEHEAKEKLLDDFLEQLHGYCDKLYFEIGGDPGDNTELIITAAGNTDYFNKAEELIAEAPEIDRWVFIALKPPIPGHFKSEWGGLRLNTEEMWFLPLSKANSTDLGFRICLKNHDLIKNDKDLMPLLYMMLDTILGERSAALDIKHVGIGLQPDDPKEKGMHPILDLPAYIMSHKSRS